MYKYNTNESRIVEGVRVCCDASKYSVYYSRPNIMKYWDYKKTMANPKLVANNEEFVMACKCPYCEHKWYQFMPTDKDHINCPKCRRYDEYMYEEDKYNSLRQAACYYYLKLIIPDLKCNFRASNGFYFDLYSKNLNLIIEVDSREFHGDSARILRDKENDKFAKDNGITIARLNPQYDGEFDNINEYARSLNKEYFDYMDDRSCDINDGVLMCLLYIRDKFGIDVSNIDIDCRRDLVKINEERNLYNKIGLPDPEYFNNGKFNIIGNPADFMAYTDATFNLFYERYGDGNNKFYPYFCNLKYKLYMDEKIDASKFIGFGF